MVPLVVQAYGCYDSTYLILRYAVGRNLAQGLCLLVPELCTQTDYYTGWCRYCSRVVQDTSGLHQSRRMGCKHHVVPLREDPENDASVAAVGYFSPDSTHPDHQLSSLERRTGAMYCRAYLSLQLYLLRCVEFRLSITYRTDALAHHISHDTGLRAVLLSDNDVLRKNLDGRETDFVEK
jgi:hypothetical protein